tara:strand:+ start:507 stop:623 length:117 start_codon:yes stop_codon:yes gene_type:complete
VRGSGQWLDFLGWGEVKGEEEEEERGERKGNKRKERRG